MPIGPILAANPNKGWGSIAGAFGAGLGQGLEDVTNYSLQQKMNALEDNRKLAAQQKAFEQQQQMREARSNFLEKQGLGTAAQLHRAGFEPQHIAALAKEYPEILESNLSSSFQSPEMGQAIRMEDREAIGEMPEVEAVRREPQTLEEYSRKIAPNYDKLGRTAKERVQRQAEREFNADAKLRKERSDIQKQQLPFIKETRAKADAAKTILSAAENMKKIRERGNLGIASGVKKVFSPETRADKAAYDTQASQFLSYYKALFPRGFTQQEFKHIEENWLPKSSNTDERNKAIEDSFSQMAQVMLQKSQILDDLRDENGNLPPNAEQKVDKIMGEEIKKLQNKFTKEVPEEEKSEDSGFKALPSAAQYPGKTIIDTKTGQKYRSNGKNWSKVK